MLENYWRWLRGVIGNGCDGLYFVGIEWNYIDYCYGWGNCVLDKFVGV